MVDGNGICGYYAKKFGVTEEAVKTLLPLRERDFYDSLHRTSELHSPTFPSEDAAKYVYAEKTGDVKTREMMVAAQLRKFAFELDLVKDGVSQAYASSLAHLPGATVEDKHDLYTFVSTYAKLHHFQGVGGVKSDDVAEACLDALLLGVNPRETLTEAFHLLAKNRPRQEVSLPLAADEKPQRFLLGPYSAAVRPAIDTILDGRDHERGPYDLHENDFAIHENPGCL